MPRVKLVILPYISPTHHIGVGMGYPISYPNHYDCKDMQTGKTLHILSKNNYAYNDEIEIDIDVAHGAQGYFLDKSPPRPPKPMITPCPPPSTLGVVDSDVIINVHNIETKGKLTIVSGSVFYVDPKLKNLTGSLRTDFHEKAAISVTTNRKTYDFNTGTTYIFPNLRDISVSHQRIHATDARMPSP